jgi:predicted DsbA family dithiol-disulfide isomerase
MRVEVWADVVCPWCYLGKRRLEHALAGFDHRDEVEIVYRSFQLDPTAPRDRVVPTAELLSGKYGMSAEQVDANQRQLEELAAAEGLEYHLTGSLSGSTHDAHRVLQLARERGLAGPVVERLYRAYFTERRSVFDAASLLDLAVEAGLDAGEVSEVLAGSAYADAVAADGAEAQALGATGVPFFVLDRRYGISGAQPTEVFSRALEQAWEARG